MSEPNSYTPCEMRDLADLTDGIRKFNTEQHGEDKLYAAVTLYRGGEDVASIDDNGAPEVIFATKAVTNG